MKQNLLNKLWLRVGMLVAIMTTALSGTAWGADVTDELTLTWTGVTGTSYKDWTGKSATSSAVYAGNSAGGNSSIQLRSKDSNSGVVTTTSGGKVKSITVVWNSETSNGRTLNVYGKNSAYSQATDLYNSSNQGTLLGTIVYGTSTSLTLSDDYEYIGFRSASGAMYLTSVTIVWEVGGTPTPSISAENVEIAYNATSGAIEYTINNSVEGGTVSAAVTSGDWLTPGTVGATVPFTCSANNTMAARTATVTLTYTYGSNQTTTKNVTVTQAADPNAVNNISDITAAGTYTVKGTIVAKSQRGFIVGDGTGYVYYYNQNYTQSDYNIGDKVKLAGAVSVYGGVYQYTNSATITAATESNYVAEEPTVLTGSQMDTRVASTTPAQLSTYVQYEGVLSVSGTYYNITSIDGASTAKGSISYPISTDFTSLNGKTVKVTGYYVGISSSQYYNTMLGSIEEVTNADPVISASNVTLAYDATSGEITYTIANPTGATLIATTSADWISNIVVSSDKVTFTATANEGNADRTATITLSYTGAQDKVVTVTQGHYVADYATLPFSFDDGKAAIENTAGLTETGLGSDYNSSPKLRFDDTGDELILKINERPGVLTFDIKNNSFSGGTFTVQTSEDGVTYTDLKVYSTITGTQSEEFTNLGANVRYIKWVYTSKSSGNVALGNIALAQYVAPANYDLTVTLSDNISAIYIFNAADENEPLITDGAAGTVQVTNGTEVLVSPDVAEGYQLASLTVDGNDVTSQIDETGAYTFTMPASNVTITATAVEYVAPVTASYVLATSITSGKHYVIANGKEDGTVKVMGSQNENNRGAVDATIAEGVLSVSDEYEFTIESASVTDGENEVSGYAICDESGYLYAASSSKNHLKTQETNNANGIWTITINGETGEASVVAESSSNRNVMQYNSGNILFSCYSSASQAPVYLFEKVEAETEEVTVTAVGYATYCSENALDFTDVTEITAYVGTIEGTHLTFTPITQVPANTGLLLKAEGGATVDVPVIASAPALTSTNCLTGTNEAITLEEGDYILNVVNGKAGFYRATTQYTALAAHRAYISAEAGQGVKSFIFDDDDATAISSVEFFTEEGAIYNVAGQRLQKMQKGINIVNGKKILY